MMVVTGVRRRVMAVVRIVSEENSWRSVRWAGAVALARDNPPFAKDAKDGPPGIEDGPLSVEVGARLVTNSKSRVTAVRRSRMTAMREAVWRTWSCGGSPVRWKRKLSWM